MKTEIEAKFLHVQPEDIRKRLKKLNATCIQPMILMRRVIFDNDIMNAHNAYLRVRDEGRKVTMTYKQFDEYSLTGAKEIEFEVSDYDNAVQLIKAIGIRSKGFQESKRETWRLKDVEVMIDIWPWVDPFIEIEGPNEESVKDAALELGLEWGIATFGDLDTAYYDQYAHLTEEDHIYHLPVIRFNDPIPDMLKTNWRP